MHRTIRRLRPLLISLVALVLSAGIAFAAKPPSHPTDQSTGLARASQQSGKTVPVATGSDEQGESSGEAESTEHQSGAPDPSGSSNDHCSTDPTTATQQQLAGLNHGAIVCWAAQQPTPNGYATHGAWVSHWAKGQGTTAPTTGATPRGIEHAAAGAPGRNGTARGQQP